MKKSWPLRWDLLVRYRLIEIIALWEGRLTTRHLTTTFGIGRQQASKDINHYLQDIAPDNLVYDPQLKGYKPSPVFQPVLTSGLADEYLHLMNRNNELSQTFESLALQIANTTVLSSPVRNIRPEIIRQLVTAARQQRRVEVDYVSVNNPDREGRIIAPHTLVYSGVRWHVRAYCEKNQDYRDFVLSRFRQTPEILDATEYSAEQDTDWQTRVDIHLQADPRLSKKQQAVIREDYGMSRDGLKVTSRGPLVHYTLKLLQVDEKVLQGKPSAQQLVLVNLAELRPWLFS